MVRIHRVVFCGENKASRHAIPIERGVQHGFRKIAVGEMIGPLALALEAPAMACGPWPPRRNRVPRARMPAIKSRDHRHLLTHVTQSRPLLSRDF